MASDPPSAHPADGTGRIGLVTLEHGSRLIARRLVVDPQLLILLEGPDPRGDVAPVRGSGRMGEVQVVEDAAWGSSMTARRAGMTVWRDH
jgi:hypothetical protein